MKTKNWISLVLLLSIALVPALSLGGKLNRKMPTPTSKNGTDLPISGGTLLEILSYDARTKTFEVRAAALPGEGESWVTPEGLAEAAEAASLERLLRDPQSFVGQQFQIKKEKELPTLFDDEKESRAGVQSKSSAPVKKSLGSKAARK